MALDAGKMGRIWLLAAMVAAASLGALGAASLAEARTSEPPPSMTVPTWSYLCFEGSSATDVMEKANHAGARGWELVSASPGRRGSVWCFKQPRWARPAQD